MGEQASIQSMNGRIAGRMFDAPEPRAVAVLNPVTGEILSRCAGFAPVS